MIKSLADAFRAKKLPVIYTMGAVRPDSWDAGSWAWKTTGTAESAPRPTNTLDANEIVAEIAPQTQDVVVLKQKPSGFPGSNL
ncbi:MAG: N-carbamoylsarcosine amidase [Hyphomicrobiales bacterium]|nr:N-carbamoylsarcosine amidase [Hyphomicrobiales bacterium]